MAKSTTPKPAINWKDRYHAGFIAKIRVRIPDVPGSLGHLLDVIGENGASLGDIRIVNAETRFKIRDIQIYFADQAQMNKALDAVRAVPEVSVLRVTDEVLEIHRDGTIETRHRVPLDTVMDLRMVYTPGVASVCELIHRNPEEAWNYTALGHKVAIVTNGTAVLGLGDIGPLASLPVMEGKAAIFSRFAGVSAEPFLIESKDPEVVADIVIKASTGYGAIQLEDIAAPACFEVERILKDALDKPVFHDDQHGTATVCVAGLLNALKRTKRKISDVRAAMLGSGAAGIAIAKFLMQLGIQDVVLCDSKGAIYKGRSEGMNRWKEEIAEHTNKAGEKGSISDIMKGKNLFIGVSKPNMITKEDVASMQKDPIIFALANPVSEIAVEDALEAGAAVAVDGRGMNNALAYPGIFRGALDARAKAITPSMMIAAAKVIASLSEEMLLPDMLDMKVHRRVAEAVAEAWKNPASIRPSQAI